MYECALLRNKTHGTEVVPIFVGEETSKDGTVQFARVSLALAASGFPDKQHDRGDDVNKLLHSLG
jgi:hypothetical protein